MTATRLDWTAIVLATTCLVGCNEILGFGGFTVTDAGVSRFDGGSMDGGPPRDAGTPRDAGPPIGVDAGPPRDAGPGPSPEVCNGVDDDGDLMIDQGFDCVQNSEASGTTACGEPGVRRCGEDCLFLDDTFYAEETASTCNYCADSPDGLAAEATVATGSSTESFLAGDLHGGIGLFVTLPVFGGGGSLTTDEPIVLGHGTTLVDAEVEVTSETHQTQGWSIFVIRDDATGFHRTGGTPPGAPLPADAEGVYGSWSWSGTDAGRLGAFDEGVDRIISVYFPVPAFAPSVDTVDQALALELTPDDPTTTANEMRVRIGYPGPPFSQLGQCIGDSCHVRFAVGDRVWVGVSGAVAMSGSTAQVVATIPRARVTRNGLCP